VWIAGSTHAGEDEAVLDAHLAALAEFPDALLLLAPRHPQRFDAVAQMLRETGLRFDRRSTGAVRPDVQVVLVDTVGELAALYAAADVAFVGGSLVPVGGHNLLEPAALGVPVLTGPSWTNGRDIALRLLAADAALEVADGAALALAVKGLLEDPERRRQMGESGRRVVEANRGSVARLVDRIDAMLS
jgi:3-deoxy-D-manno-octulosonic-acid transferase